jgi:acetate CoA/acetoacetate CoA-transferase beta subunit
VNVIITDMAVMEVTTEGLIVTELMSPYTVEDVQRYTGAALRISESLNSID